MSSATVVRTAAGGTVRRIRSVADTSVVSDGRVTMTHVRAVSNESETQGKATAQKIAVYGFGPGNGSGGNGGATDTITSLKDMILTEIGNRHAGDLNLYGDIAANRAALQAAINEAREAADQAHNELVDALNIDHAQTDAAIQAARDAAAQAHNELQDALDLETATRVAAVTEARNAAAAAHDELEAALTLETTTRETAVSDARNAASAAHDELQSALSFEAATRESADATIASSVTTVATRVDAAESNITTEIASRTTADSALGLRIDSVTASLGDVSAAVTTEIAARATADEALGGRIDTVKADLDAASAAITSEQTARVTADTALGTRIDTVKASVDSNTAAISTETTSRVTADEAIGVRIDTLKTTVDGNTAAISSESVTRSDHDSALSDRIDTVSAATGTNAANLTTEVTARTTADSALGARIDTLKTTVDGNTAAITSEEVARTTADTALAGRIDTLKTTVDSNTAAITSEATTRSDHDSALSTRIDTLTATVGDNSAAITSESMTRATADTAIGVRIDTLKTTVDGNTAAITSESVTRSDHDLALSDRIDTVNAAVGTNAANLSSEVTARADGDSALGARIDTLKTTVDGNTAAISSEALTRSTHDDALAGLITTLTTTVDGHTAAISSEAITRSDHDSALSTRIDSLTATVGDNTAAITSEQTVRATADEALGVRIDTLKTTVDGNTAAITSESVTRSTHDSALSDRIDTVTASVGTTNANLSSETTARVTADSALGARIDTITASLGDTNAAVTSESAARVTADTALAGRIDTVQADLGTTNANVTSEHDARVTADSALGARIDTVTANLGTANAAITSESVARTTADTALGARIDTIQTSVDANSAAISNEVTARTTADSALAGRIDTTDANVAGNAAAIASEVAARAAADLAETTARQEQSSSVAASGVKGAWVQGSAPDWEAVYPIGVNRIINADLSAGDTVAYWDNTGLTSHHGIDYDTTWVLPNGHTGWAYLDGTPPAGTLFQLGPMYMPVKPGSKYESSVYVASHRCSIILDLVFWNADFSAGHEYFSSDAAGNDLNGGAAIDTYGASGDLSTYTRLWSRAVVPEGCVWAQLAIRGVNCGINPYIFWTRPKFALMAPGQTKVSDWTPSIAPVWFDTSDSNRPKIVKQGDGSKPAWVLTDDQRIAANAANITAVNAALTSESATRATADAAETAQREAAVSSLQHGLDLANAAITSEATTRATADAAETSAREAAVSTLTTGLSSANAAIASEASTRAAADEAEATARKTMSSSLSTPGGCFADPLFVTNPLGTNRTPNGWTEETYFAGSSTITTTGARFADRVLRLDVPANTNVWAHKGSDEGGWQGASGNRAGGQRYFVVELDFEFLSGNLASSGIVVTNRNAARDAWLNTNNIPLSSIAGSATPATGNVYSLRKVVDCGAPQDGGDTLAYILGSWGGMADYAGSQPAKSFLIHRFQLRPATQAEIDTQTAGGAIASAINAAITTEATTRAAADLAETTVRQSQVSMLSVPGLIKDPIFATSTVGHSLPAGWGDWNYGAANSDIVTSGAKYGDRVLRCTAVAGQDSGIYVHTSGFLSGYGPVSRYAVWEVEFELLSGGTFAGAGIYTYLGGAGNTLHFADAAPSPVTGRIYSMRKVVDYGVAPDGTNVTSHLMYSWGGFGAGNNARQFLVHRIQVRAASQEEIDTKTAGGAIGAAITDERNTRVTNDNALASSITALTTRVGNNESAITTEATTRANAIASEALARQTVSSTSQRKVWKQATAPGPGNMFPPGSNRLVNSDLIDTTGWNYNAGSGSGSLGVDLTNYRIEGGHTLYVNSDQPSTDFLAYYTVTAGITQSNYYEFSAYLGCHRCTGRLQIDWYNTSGFISSTVSTTSGNGAEFNGGSVAPNSYLGGTSLSGYRRLWVHGQAPTGATWANVYFAGTGNGEGNPYVFMTRPFFGRIPSDQTTPSDYSPSATEQVWVNTADNNKTYVWNGASWVYSADARIDSNSAAITVAQSSIGGLQAKYGVTGTINGVTGGFVLSGIGKNDGSASWLLEITSNVIIHGNLVIDGTISTGKLGANAVSHALNVASTSGTASGSLTVRAGSTVQIIAAYNGGDELTAGGSLVIKVNGTTQVTSPVPYWMKVIGTSGSGGKDAGGYSFTYYATSTLTSCAYAPGSDGTLSIEAIVTTGGYPSGKVSLIAIELAR